MSKPEMPNCLDIVKPYVEAVIAPGMPEVQILGGVGSAALRDEATVILFDEERIIAPPDLYLPQFRDEGTKRDVETLVLSTDPLDNKRVKQCAKDTIGKQLIIETFPLLDASDMSTLYENPLGKNALLAALSDRYVDTSQGPDAGVQRILFPFATEISAEALKSWTLEIGDITMPVPSPAANIINYLTRSLSGLRPKDAEKVEEMGRAIFAKSPELVGWIMDGPGKDQFEMARVFHTLRERKRKPEVLVIGGRLVVEAYSYDELREHPTFMLADRDDEVKDKVLRLAHLKSRGLHIGEGMKWIIGPFQKYVEPRIQRITHNKAD